MNKNLSTENLFLFKNITKHEHSIKNLNKNNLHNHNNHLRGLNHGFIMDDMKDYNPTSSQGSISGLRINIQSEESRGKNGDTQSASDLCKKNKEEKMYNIDKKMENIKNSYTLTGPNSNL
jgi:hypothetical protein